MSKDLAFVTGKPFLTRDGVSQFIPIYIYSIADKRWFSDQVAVASRPGNDGTDWKITLCEPASQALGLDLLCREKAYTVDEVISIIENADVESVIPPEYFQRIIQVRTIAGRVMYVADAKSSPRLVSIRSQATPLSIDEAGAFLEDFKASGTSVMDGVDFLIPGDEISSMYIEPLFREAPEHGRFYDVTEGLEGSAVPAGYSLKESAYIVERCSILFGEGH